MMIARVLGKPAEVVAVMSCFRSVRPESDEETEADGGGEPVGKMIFRSSKLMQVEA